jgi:hypothetical protein
MHNSLDAMKALTISPQVSSDSDITTPLSIGQSDSKGSFFNELSEIGERLSYEFSTSEDDGDDVFREGRRNIGEEMLLVLKRANTISDYRDDSDIIDSPMAKRKRRTYDFEMELDERDGVEENPFALEADGDDRDQRQDGNVPTVTTEILSISSILTITKQASSLCE